MWVVAMWATGFSDSKEFLREKEVKKYINQVITIILKIWKNIAHWDTGCSDMIDLKINSSDLFIIFAYNEYLIK